MVDDSARQDTGSSGAPGFAEGRARAQELLREAKAYTDAQLKNHIGRVRVALDGVTTDVAARHRLNLVGGWTATDNPTRDAVDLTPPAGGGGAYAGWHLWRSASQAIASATPTFITFDTEDQDTDAFHSLVSNTDQVVIPAGMGGEYSGGIAVQLGAMTGRQHVELLMNRPSDPLGWGTYYLADFDQNQGVSALHTITIPWRATLQAGDSLQVRVTQQSGSSVSATSPGAAYDHRFPAFWGRKDA